MTARFRSPARRLVAGLALAVLAAVGAGTAQASPADRAGGADDARAAPARGTDLPVFTSTGPIVDPSDPTLPHNPTGEFIFPSVFHAGEHLADPLGEWYIYFAPHDAPGGIELMYADSLDGPWTQYAGNPVISRAWDPHYTVSHVSSPDAVWNDDEDRMYLYFHGENSVTRYATSTDGVTFTYGDEVVDTAMVDAAQPGRSATETSYARVFRNPDRTSRDRWVMFFMTNYSTNVRHINVATSPDGREWDVLPEPLVTPSAVEGTNVAAADLWTYKGTPYVVYGSTVGTTFARTVDPKTWTAGDPEPLYIPRQAPPEAGRATSPQIVSDGDTTHLFYETGERSHTTIAHAVIDPHGWRDPLNPHPEDPMYEQCPAPGSDEFDGTALDRSLWSTAVRGELDRSVVADGAWRIPTYTGNSTSAPLVLQPLPDAPWEVTTKLTLDPQQNFQQAGAIVRRDDANSARISLSHVDAGKRFDFIWRRDGVDRNNTWTMEDTELAPPETGDTVWLRITGDGDWLTASYSIDGATFRNLGRAIPAGDLDATDVGAFAYRGPETTAELTAEFDWFRFSPSEEQLAGC
jgi:regulation of enolase protein 1 (concanavalin A-like superfamily)